MSKTDRFPTHETKDALVALPVLGSAACFQIASSVLDYTRLTHELATARKSEAGFLCGIFIVELEGLAKEVRSLT